MMRTRGTPVIAGSAAPTQGPPLACVACETTEGVRVPAILDEIGASVLCRDAMACCDRYRGGASPETYAAGLRGELLAVAP